MVNYEKFKEMGEIIKKPALQIHAETARMLSKLDNGKAGLIIKAMCEYHFNDDPDWLKDQSLRLGFEFLRERIDYDRAAYAARCARNSENAVKRWPKDDMRPDAMASDGIRPDAKHAKLKDKDKGSKEPEEKVKKEKKEILRNWLKRGWNKFYHRRKGTAWSKKELDKLGEIIARPEVLTEHRDILRLYNGGYLYVRKDLQTLLNNWTGELDKAHGQNGQYGRSGQGNGAGNRNEERGRTGQGMSRAEKYGAGAGTRT